MIAWWTEELKRRAGWMRVGLGSALASLREGDYVRAIRFVNFSVRVAVNFWPLMYYWRQLDRREELHRCR